ncbi:MAG: histidine ammonia-lyase [Phaeodactylibacter sp.]|nr:histidine ammonia-lyase [Phaeodactylibacter sp.]MCB9276716.1 histidine ammonia-lyase [Lewinellaceae bacterium]
MDQVHYISAERLTLEQISAILEKGVSLALSEESRQRIRHCRAFLDDKLQHSDELFYGINTGFGSLCHIRISKEQTISLQHNLVQSHACGTGAPVPPAIVQLMLLLKIQSLAYGYSGVRLGLVERLAELFNRGILPVVYEQGSLGASGDLAPLAHLSLPLIGLGAVWQNGQALPSDSVLADSGLAPMELQAKEGLALLNGTQFSGAYLGWCLLQARRLFGLANLCAALSADAFDCQLSPFDGRLHIIRPHEGQQRVAADIRWWLQGSALAQREKQYVQDPYAFRCVPQVHGASWGAISHAEQVFLTEANAVTDNPNIFPDTDAILSGGNFHAQPLALALDYLAIALAELGSISERRVYQLISGNRGLPSFLTSEPGLNSGLMIPQYTAASIVSQNKQLCTPASVDSIVSSNGQEDHVSMAANAATKCYRVVENLERLLAIEWMTAAQAMEFRRPEQSSPALEQILADYRLVVPKVESDRVLHDDIIATIGFFREGAGRFPKPD